jgi:hypothetical protein
MAGVDDKQRQGENHSGKTFHGNWPVKEFTWLRMVARRFMTGRLFTLSSYQRSNQCRRTKFVDCGRLELTSICSSLFAVAGELLHGLIHTATLRAAFGWVKFRMRAFCQ